MEATERLVPSVAGDPVYSSKQFIQTQGTNAETSPAPETFTALVNPSLHSLYDPIMRDGHAQDCVS